MYFSKQFDLITKGWPVCLRAIVASCDLLQEEEEFTWGQPTAVHSPPMYCPY